MSIPSGDLYQLARVRYEDRQFEADLRRAGRFHADQVRTTVKERIQRTILFVGMALLPLGDSLRTPMPDSRLPSP